MLWAMCRAAAEDASAFHRLWPGVGLGADAPMLWAMCRAAACACRAVGAQRPFGIRRSPCVGAKSLELPAENGEPFGCFGRGSAAKRLSPALDRCRVRSRAPEAAKRFYSAALCASAFHRLWPGVGLEAASPKPQTLLLSPPCVRAPFSGFGPVQGLEVASRSRDGI